MPRLYPWISFTRFDLYDNENCIKKFPTFEQFLQYLIKTQPHLYNEHWATFSKNCGTCIVEYDAAVKMETMAEDMVGFI